MKATNVVDIVKIIPQNRRKPTKKKQNK
jgi:hypothetical protein